jgi:hypothetical protein
VRPGREASDQTEVFYLVPDLRVLPEKVFASVSSLLVRFVREEVAEVAFCDEVKVVHPARVPPTVPVRVCIKSGGTANIVGTVRISPLLAGRECGRSVLLIRRFWVQVLGGVPPNIVLLAHSECSSHVG